MLPQLRTVSPQGLTHLLLNPTARAATSMLGHLHHSTPLVSVLGTHGGRHDRICSLFSPHRLLEGPLNSTIPNSFRGIILCFFLDLSPTRMYDPHGVQSRHPTLFKWIHFGFARLSEIPLRTITALDHDRAVESFPVENGSIVQREYTHYLHAALITLD